MHWNDTKLTFFLVQSAVFQHESTVWQLIQNWIGLFHTEEGSQVLFHENQILKQIIRNTVPQSSYHGICSREESLAWGITWLSWYNFESLLTRGCLLNLTTTSKSPHLVRLVVQQGKLKHRRTQWTLLRFKAQKWIWIHLSFLRFVPMVREYH